MYEEWTQEQKNDAAREAAFRGEKERVEELLACGASREAATMGAALGNQIELVEELHGKKITDHNLELIVRVLQNQRSLVEQLITQKGASIDLAVQTAAYADYRDWVEQL